MSRKGNHYVNIIQKMIFNINVNDNDNKIIRLS